MHAGVRENDAQLELKLDLFHTPEAPMKSYRCTLRVDRRDLFYGKVLRDATDWFATFPALTPTNPPPVAFEPIYSTWYSYHQEVYDNVIEQECKRAREYGLAGVIVDDGWQTNDHSGGYAFTGDWQLASKRFQDFPAHVKRVQAMGMKYLLWFSVPFIGFQSKNYSRFEGKYLYCIERLRAAVLDPRFPEVRECLIG